MLANCDGRGLIGGVVVHAACFTAVKKVFVFRSVQCWTVSFVYLYQKTLFFKDNIVTFVVQKATTHTDSDIPSVNFLLGKLCTFMYLF